MIISTNASLPEQPSAGMVDYHVQVAEWLARRTTYPDRPRTVGRLETHISEVFLTDRFVYKLKKPVKFEFLDFSRVELRREACENEFRLNRRMAPAVYLAVLPVGLDRRGRPCWIDPADRTRVATAIDWVVKMRRLPAELALDRMIVEGRVSAAQVDALARRLADYYRQAVPLVVDPQEYRTGIEQHVTANLAELLRPEHRLDADLVRRVHAAQLQYLNVSGKALLSRVADGRVIDGHGDLRPEHVVLTDPPVVFDCVEFNAEFRRVDVVDELCFLAMECDRLGAGSIGQRVLEQYRSVGSDPFSDSLAAFYKCYRACVRAKVAALRHLQTADAADLSLAADYLRLADGYRQAFHQPLVLICSGWMGTGKSTLAKALQQRLGCNWLRTDEVRRELFGSSVVPQGYEEGNYTQARRDDVYRELFRRGGDLLAAGESVVFDGAFLSAEHQRRALQLAQQFSASALLVRCQCPDDEARQRIADRALTGGDPSEARPELLQQQKLTAEPPPPELPVRRVDTTVALEAQLQTVFRHLERSGGQHSAAQ